MYATVSKLTSMGDFPKSVSRFHVAMFSSSKPQFTSTPILYVRRPALPSVSELIKSGLFFGETTSYEVFLFSSQESLQNFSVSFDVRLVHEQEVIPRV
jgi:hypothetical protein